MKKNKDITIGFWGGPEISLIVLNRLHVAGFPIAFIVTSLDQPKGRNLVITPPPAKVWGLEHNIPVLQTTDLHEPTFKNALKAHNADVFVVMAYGRIIPEDLLNIPKAGSINIHPSLLPKYRGASPIESAILANEKETGVTLIHMDHEMDHGSIIAQEKVIVEPWPPTSEDLGTTLVAHGSDLLVGILSDWVAGKVKEREQDHAQATFTKKFMKEDGQIDLAADPYKNYLKIQAFHRSPTTYFFKDGKRVKITAASFKDGKLIIEKVIPEGRSEMKYTDLQKQTPGA